MASGVDAIVFLPLCGVEPHLPAVEVAKDFVTLGFFTGVRGLVFLVSEGRTASGFGDTFAILGRGRVRWLEEPVRVAIAAVTVLPGAVFLYKTRWGRYVVAIGVNSERPSEWESGSRRFPYTSTWPPARAARSGR